MNISYKNAIKVIETTNRLLTADVSASTTEHEDVKIVTGPARIFANQPFRISLYWQNKLRYIVTVKIKSKTVTCKKLKVTYTSYKEVICTSYVVMFIFLRLI